MTGLSATVLASYVRHLSLISLAAIGSLASPDTIQAQINRSDRPNRSSETDTRSKTTDSPKQSSPSTPPSAASNSTASASNSTERHSRTNRDSERSIPTSDRNNRTEGSASGTLGVPLPSPDRIRKTKEGSDSSDSSGKDNRFYYSPYFLFPDVYGYTPYGTNNTIPPIFPVSRYPEETTDSRFYSIYLYCEDMQGVTYAERDSIFRDKVRRIHTPIPIFRGKELVAWKNLGAADYDKERNLNHSAYRVGEKETFDSSLVSVVSHITESWRSRDIEPLAKHLFRRSRIAIILNGNYQYSMEAGDFLKLTQSALDSALALPFIPDHLHKKSDTVSVLTGRRPCSDRSGAEREIYFSYTLELKGDVYQITQIATAPDHL